MSINVKQSIIVRPFKETTPGQSIWLSSLDLMARTPYTHATSTYVYPPTGTEFSSSTNFFDTKILTDSLSRMLVPYYPMAGRLKINKNDGDRLEIDCNNEGVLFVEAETTNTLSDLGDFGPNTELRTLLIPKCDYSKGISAFPLAMFQLTRFKCGGVTLGLALHHHLHDGPAGVRFVNSWSRVARGLDIDVMPIHDRRAYLSPRDPPLIKFQHSFTPTAMMGNPQVIMNLETTTLATALFKLSKDQIYTLKQRATSELINHQPTTFEVLAGHIWRSVCKARGLNDSQETKLFIHTDGRPRLKDPTLPSGYCGNAIFITTCTMKVGDVVSNTLGYVAKRINESLKVMDNEYLRSAIDFFESHPNLNDLVHHGHSGKYPNMAINYWGKGMPMYEADFGWGKPLFAGRIGIGSEGRSFIVPNMNGGGISLPIGLFTHHMALFPKYFYDLERS